MWCAELRSAYTVHSMRLASTNSSSYTPTCTARPALQTRAAVIDSDDCALGYRMLDIATVVASVGGCTSRGPAGYDAFAQRFLRAYASVTPLPASVRAFARLPRLEADGQLELRTALEQSDGGTVGAAGHRRHTQDTRGLRCR